MGGGRVDLRLPEWPQVPYLYKGSVNTFPNVKIVSNQGHYLNLNG